MSIGFGVWFLVQGLHDVSVDLWTISSMEPSPNVALAVAVERLEWWRNYYEWRSDEILLKGTLVLSPVLQLQAHATWKWALAVFVIPVGMFLFDQVRLCCSDGA